MPIDAKDEQPRWGEVTHKMLCHTQKKMCVKGSSSSGQWLTNLCVHPVHVHGHTEGRLVSVWHNEEGWKRGRGLKVGVKHKMLLQLLQFPPPLNKICSLISLLLSMSSTEKKRKCEKCAILNETWKAVTHKEWKREDFVTHFDPWRGERTFLVPLLLIHLFDKRVISTHFWTFCFTFSLLERKEKEKRFCESNQKSHVKGLVLSLGDIITYFAWLSEKGGCIKKKMCSKNWEANHQQKTWKVRPLITAVEGERQKK